MTKEDELNQLLEMARKIIKESGCVDSEQEINQIITLMKNSPEASSFLGEIK